MSRDSWRRMGRCTIRRSSRNRGVLAEGTTTSFVIDIFNAGLSTPGRIGRTGGPGELGEGGPPGTRRRRAP